MTSETINFNIATAYNRLRVHQRQGLFELYSDDNALQSVVDLRAPHQLMLKNLEHLMAVLLFIPAPGKILLLGTAAGSMLHYLRYYLRQSRITAVDIDAELVEKLLQMQVLPPAADGLDYVFDDAAHFIAHSNQSYDLILVDIFTGAQSPRWLLDKKCTDRLHGLLSVDGALAYNLLIDSEHDFKLFYRDLRLVFKRQTLCLPVKDFENSIAFGIRHVVPKRDMQWYLRHATEQSEQLGIDFLPILSLIYSTNPAGHGVI
ncbi:MAG: hypothetical protein OEN02_12915 [Gammaproteobacteria bacterium]|nr:hypothetical protein [Gammaproteobacteria bacterium]